MAAYSQLWEILQELYGIKDPVGKGPMRARLQKLQDTAIPRGAQVGKGKRVDYNLDQIYQVVFALELMDAGLTPSLTFEAIRNEWPIKRLSSIKKKYLVDILKEPIIEITLVWLIIINNISVDLLLNPPPTFSEKDKAALESRPFVSVTSGIFNRDELNKILVNAKWRHILLLNIAGTVSRIDAAIKKIAPELARDTP